MLNIGMTELLIFGIIALLVLGPEKLPEAVRFVGKWYGKIKRTVGNIQNDFDRELRLSELREEMQAELKRIQALEAKMQAQMNERHTPILSDQETFGQRSQPLVPTTDLRAIQLHHHSNHNSNNYVYIATAQPLCVLASTSKVTRMTHMKQTSKDISHPQDLAQAYTTPSALKVAV